MTLPSLLFGLLLAAVYAATFHLWQDGGLGRLSLYFVLSAAGFLGGHFIGEWSGWRLMLLGPLDVGFATLGSLVFLFAGHWLSRVRVRPE